jgi:L-aminopeptidase/D-esterase-like protein
MLRRQSLAVALMLLVVTVPPSALQAQGRARARELGVAPGVFAPGPLNGITDVAGVRVGQVTITEGQDVRTGGTAILPHEGNPYLERVPAAVHVGNGYGKLLGVTQWRELGELERLAARGIMGLARTGSSASNGSGDCVLAFSTAREVRRRPLTPGTADRDTRQRTVEDLANEPMSGLFQAVVEATEEAIYNSMFAATTVTGNGRTVEALPLDKVRAVLRQYGIAAR